MSRTLIMICIFLLLATSVLQRLIVERIEKDIVKQEQKIERLENDIKEMKRSIEILNNRKVYTGTASYYSEANCIGCREDLLMANGERFNEDSYTIAMNKMPLNSIVTVTNLTTNDKITVKVTDTGGFEDLGRIADLSKGVKEAINCRDLCKVMVMEVK